MVEREMAGKGLKELRNLYTAGAVVVAHALTYPVVVAVLKCLQTGAWSNGL